MRAHAIAYTLLIALLGISCEIKKSDVAPETSFIRVYETTNIEEAYHPQNITQLPDKEYIVLSSLDDSTRSNYPKVSLTALTSAGGVIESVVLPENYTNPVPEWILINDQYYFVCMDDITLQAKLIQVSLNNGNLNYSELMEFDRRMPLFAWSEGENILLLSYDRIGRNSVIDLYDDNFNPQWQSSIPANEDFENDIRLHLKKQGKTFPFFIGKIHDDEGMDSYFVNCLANYSMALLFLESASGTVTGRLYTYQEETSISSALHLYQDTFAVSRYHSGDNYVFPRVRLDIHELQNTENFNDILISQFKADANTDIMLYTLDEKQYIVYASTNKSNQIVLLFFNAKTGEQVNGHTLGYGNPVEVANIIQTEDDGISVLGKTWINSQYQRMIIYKLSADQLELD